MSETHCEAAISPSCHSFTILPTLTSEYCLGILKVRSNVARSLNDSTLGYHLVRYLTENSRRPRFQAPSRPDNSTSVYISALSPAARGRLHRTTRLSFCPPE